MGGAIDGRAAAGKLGTAGGATGTAGRGSAAGGGATGSGAIGSIGSGGGTITGGGATATGGGGGAATAGAGTGAAAATPTAKIPRHTEQRASTPPAGTFAGSTRKTVEQVGQVTFMRQSPSSCPGSWRRSTTKTDPGSVLA